MGLIALGLWLDGSLIVPIAGRGHTGSCPVLIANQNRSMPGEGKHADCNYRCWNLAAPFSRHILAQLLTWLMLITIAIGSYLMNGYFVVKEHEKSEKRPLTLFAVE